MYPQAVAPNPQPPRGPDPRPSAALLGDAWRLQFKNLGVFLPLALIELVVSSGLDNVEHTLGELFGIPIRYDDYSVAQWLIARAFDSVASCLFWVPFEAVTYSVCFAVLAGSPSPLDELRHFGKYYANALQFAFVVAVARTCSQFLIRLIAPPGEMFFHIFISLCIDLPLMLTIPAMVRFDMNFMDAMQYSWRRVNRDFFRFVGYYFGAGILSISGIVLCLIGMFLTSEIYNVALAMLFFVPPFAVAPYVGPGSPYPRWPQGPISP